MSRGHRGATVQPDTNRLHGMKRTITALALLMIAAGAHAQSDTEGCKAYGEAAYSVMINRQAGFSPETVYEKVDEAGVEMTPTFRRMISEAYEVPQTETADGWKRAANDYRDRWFARCMESQGNG